MVFRSWPGLLILPLAFQKIVPILAEDDDEDKSRGLSHREWAAGWAITEHVKTQLTLPKLIRKLKRPYKRK